VIFDLLLCDGCVMRRVRPCLCSVMAVRVWWISALFALVAGRVCVLLAATVCTAVCVTRVRVLPCWCWPFLIMCCAIFPRFFGFPTVLCFSSPLCCECRVDFIGPWVVTNFQKIWTWIGTNSADTPRNRLLILLATCESSFFRSGPFWIWITSDPDFSDLDWLLDN